MTLRTGPSGPVFCWRNVQSIRQQFAQHHALKAIDQRLAFAAADRDGESHRRLAQRHNQEGCAGKLVRIGIRLQAAQRLGQQSAIGAPIGKLDVAQLLSVWVPDQMSRITGSVRNRL